MYTCSFTGERQVRFAPTSRVALCSRLIALANVLLAALFRTPHAGEAALDGHERRRSWWYLVRTLFVDRRVSVFDSVWLRHGDHGPRTIERERRVAWMIPPS